MTRQEHLGENIEAIYDALTDGRRRSLRVSELVYAAADRFPGLVPTRTAIDEERERLQKDKLGLEIDQGTFVAHVLAHPGTGAHLMHAMSQPRHEAEALLDELQRTDAVDLGPMRLDRDGKIGVISIQNHAFLNSEDDVSTSALEVAVDLVLLDDSIDVGVLRGAPATHPKHAGRRIFGSGINLTHLYHGKIALVEFMIERELGVVSKMYRGHDLGEPEGGVLEDRREKPWIAAVESFAIGGACQWLLVMDRVIAEQGSYFNLPARREGIIPGCANLRLPRLVGDRIARQGILFDRKFAAASPEGRMICDEVVPPGQMDAAIEAAVGQLTGSGMVSAAGNRKAIRVGQEPIDTFRAYMATYAREQVLCQYSRALIRNLEANWNAHQRRALA